MVVFSSRNKHASLSRLAMGLSLAALALLAVNCRPASFTAVNPSDQAASLDADASLPDGHPAHGGDADALGQEPTSTPSAEPGTESQDGPNTPDGAGDPTQTGGTPDDPAPIPTATPAPSPAPSPSPTGTAEPTPETLAKLCAEAPVALKKTLAFTDPGKTCDFGKNDNLAAKNDYIQARAEQTTTIDLPAGAIVCSLKFAAPKQAFAYDDQFALILNGLVVARSQAFPALSAKVGAYTKYDWLKLRGQSFASSKLEPSCAGVTAAAGLCVVPTSGTTPGNLEISIPDVTALDVLGTGGVTTVSTYATNKDKAIKPTATLAVFGDNDSTDCRNSSLNVTLEFTYALLPVAAFESDGN